MTNKSWQELSARVEGLSAGAIRVLVALETVTCRATGWASITIRNLMARADVSRATVFRALATLVRKGLLLVTPQFARGQRANRYRLVNLTPEATAAAERARQDRKQAVRLASTARRQDCLRSYAVRLETYVWGRVCEAMGHFGNETPLPISGSQEDAVKALRGINLAIWQQRSRPGRIFRSE